MDVFNFAEHQKPAFQRPDMIKHGMKVMFCYNNPFNPKSSALVTGMTGVVKGFEGSTVLRVAVEFDKRDKRLHNCDGITERGKGQWMLWDELAPLLPDSESTLIP